MAEAAQEARTTDAWRTDVDAEVYTVQQAAGWLKVSPSKGYEMCRRGELKHGRFGNAIRIHRRSLLAALGNREVEKR